jgi:hypothetical protein
VDGYFVGLVKDAGSWVGKGIWDGNRFIMNKLIAVGCKPTAAGG